MTEVHSSPIATPLPGQLMDLAPNRPPDLHCPALDSTLWGRIHDAARRGHVITSAAVWLPTDTEPGYAYARRAWNNFGYNQTLAITTEEHVSRITAARSMGMAGIIDATGVKASIVADPRHEGVTHYELIFPSQEEFCKRIDDLADQGNVHVRVAVNTHPGLFTVAELAHSLGRDDPRLLIARPEAKPSVEDFEHWIHDSLFHILGYLGLDPESAAVLRQKGQIALTALLNGDMLPAEKLLNDLEGEMAITDIIKCANNPSLPNIKCLDDPTAKEPSASKRVSNYLRQLRLAAEQPSIP